MRGQDLEALLAPPNIWSGKKALCVQPHPDDNEVGMGGIVAKLVQNGCEVHYLTITNGDLGGLDPQAHGPELAARRAAETRAAGDMLGVTAYHSFGLPDGSLNDVAGLAERIAEVIRGNGCDMLFCPDPWLPYEAHWDHVVTGRACAKAFLAAGLPSYPRGTRTKASPMFAIGFYYTSQANTVVDITDCFEQKMEAIAAHESQFAGEALETLRAYLLFHGQRLSKREHRIGEGLKVLAPVHMHCFPENAEV